MKNVLTPTKPMAVRASADTPRPTSAAASADIPVVQTAAKAAKPAGEVKSVKALDFDVPEKIGKYVLQDKLGSGTCGIVFKARDDMLGRDVAVKLSPIGKPDVSTGKVPGAQRAFLTELFAAGKLKHPNIVTVYDAGQDGELNYLVMEQINGYSLKSVGKGQKLLQPFRALEVIIECCHALDYAHAQGIVHRDIKPANIMMGRDGSVKLLDFGIAVKTSVDGTAAGPTLGTPNYMSPEQIRGKALGPASDFYSLGTVLFELLTGKQLFKAKKVKDLFRVVVGEIAPALSDIRPDLPDALSDVVAKALNKLPDQRFQSGREFAQALQPIAEQMRLMAKRSRQQLLLIRQLRALDFFQDFDEGEVALFLNKAIETSCYDGDMLIDEGATSRQFSVITGGVVVVRRKGRVVQILGEGDTIGEFGFIHDDPSPLRVIAQSNVSLLSVNPDFLAELPPAVHLHYYKRISESLVHKISSQDRLVLDLEFSAD
ncbi:MAG TPA: serine/threonine protein kinase [Gammaproteobacteria bacterium]|nr:serine/threonine protein kinase [Gammaproteobacteria bacterium]